MKNENNSKNPKQDRYLKYVDKKSKSTNTFKNILWAFIVGGTICSLSQFISNFYREHFDLSKESANFFVTLTLIFLSAISTGLNFYDKLAKYAGAGTLVPITGFANSVVSPAMEFKKEGFILGAWSKMFIIAGPILVSGIACSVIIGLIYLLFGNFCYSYLN